MTGDVCPDQGHPIGDAGRVYGCPICKQIRRRR